MCQFLCSKEPFCCFHVHQIMQGVFQQLRPLLQKATLNVQTWMLPAGTGINFCAINFTCAPHALPKERNMNFEENQTRERFNRVNLLQFGRRRCKGSWKTILDMSFLPAVLFADFSCGKRPGAMFCRNKNSSKLFCRKSHRRAKGAKYQRPKVINIPLPMSAKHHVRDKAIWFHLTESKQLPTSQGPVIGEYILWCTMVLSPSMLPIVVHILGICWV